MRKTTLTLTLLTTTLLSCEYQETEPTADREL